MFVDLGFYGCLAVVVLFLGWLVLGFCWLVSVVDFDVLL